jgi:hypothetical protein
VTHHFHQPQPGTPVTDRTGGPCTAATADSYPLNAYCACGAYLSCASGDADWADADPTDCPNGGPHHRSGVVGRKPCTWCDDIYYNDPEPTPDRPLPILQGLMDDVLRGAL